MHRSVPHDDSMWQNEIQAYQEFAKFEHGNIIKLIAAITKDRERCLVLEWADGGNLRDFWACNPRLGPNLVKDTILQLHGLADALGEIHRKNYRLGNIKPENILRKRIRVKQPNSSGLDIGTLKICSMGLATNVQTDSPP